MTLPSHSVKHVRNTYRKAQILAALFALLTIAATFFVAFSGIQITRLEKQQPPRETSTTDVDPSLFEPYQKKEKELNQEIKTLQAQLADEKKTTKTLRTKMADLESRLAAIHKAVAPAVSKPATETPLPSKIESDPKPKDQPAQPPRPERKPQKPAPQKAPTPEPKAAPIPQPEKTPASPEPTPPSPAAKPESKTVPPAQPSKTPPAPNTPNPQGSDAPDAPVSSTPPPQTTAQPPATDKPLVTEKIPPQNAPEQQ